MSDNENPPVTGGEPTAPPLTEAEQEAKAKEEREAALRKAYTLATTALRTEYQSEFNAIYKAEAKKLGYDWEPKKSAEDKAREQIAEILEKHPKLAEELAATSFEVKA